MKISVFGLGYVGAVTAACLAREGHEVVGVDVSPVKVDLINRGQAPIIEPGVPEIIEDAVGRGAIRATTDSTAAIAATDISLVCVGTPSRRNGSLDTRAVEAVCGEIGRAIAGKSSRHTVVIRSTILPGTMRGLVIPALEAASGLAAGTDFGVANNPEFLRESTAVKDFYNPPKTVIGSLHPETGKAVAELYAMLDAPLFVTSVETAELVKYADNAWHALKVAFGNEIGNIAKALSIDSHEVMEIFCQDTKLNISRTYLMPGFAFGGSCLPKDLRALTYMGRSLDLALPVLDSVLPSNREQIDRCVERILATGRRKIAFLGFSFKAGTDDLRESPQVEVIERLIGKGCELRLYDRNVHLARLTGANQDYILRVIPHIAELMSEDLAATVAHGEIVVIGNNDPAFAGVPGLMRADQRLVDLVRIPGTDGLGDRYDGINW
ncbi:MAG: UDP-glucose/GDP-mannose dehydrogenase family protein [Alphaproteobacteria bacterium]|nr:UDP-glucose/GDP-mannose dehydrogenase family protein [Alphaproteobacteria bacterium]